MRAALLGAYGQPQSFSIQKVPIPVPAPHQLLVKVAASPINPSDLGFIMGKYAFKRPLPAIPGNECSGVVVSDPVGGLEGKEVACLSESTAQGAWAEYVLTSRDNAVLVPAGVSLPEAACFFVNPLTAAMFRHTILQNQHQAVVQTAAGSSLAKMLIRVCDKLSIPIVNIVRRPAQVPNFPSQHILCSSNSDFPIQLKDICTRLNVTGAFDAVAGEMAGELLSALCEKGVLYMYGSLSELPARNMKAEEFIFKRKKVKGLFLTGWLKGMEKEERRRLYEETMRDLTTLYKTDISQVFPLDSIQSALSFYQHNMSLGKVLITPN